MISGGVFMQRAIHLFFPFLMAATLMLVSFSAEAARRTGGNVKSLIVYYSYSGNTEVVSKALAEELKADTLVIRDSKRPSVLKAYVSGAFAARRGKSWPVMPVNADFSRYDRIFVGAPVWWGRNAPQMNTFVNNTDFLGKPVVVFVTMMGSNPQEALKALSSRVEARGGRVVSTFSVRMGGVSKADIVTKTKHIASQYK